MLCFTQLGYRDVAVTGWDKAEKQGSTWLSNAVINLLLFFTNPHCTAHVRLHVYNIEACLNSDVIGLWAARSVRPR